MLNRNDTDQNVQANLRNNCCNLQNPKSVSKQNSKKFDCKNSDDDEYDDGNRNIQANNQAMYEALKMQESLAQLIELQKSQSKGSLNNSLAIIRPKRSTTNLA